MTNSNGKRSENKTIKQNLFRHAKAAEQVRRITVRSLHGTKQLLTKIDRRVEEC